MTETRFLQGQPTHQRELDNGLTVIVREDHSAPVVAVVTYVRAGYFDESDDVVGISHVLEHMYFKGTARRGAGEIARETKLAGGYLNAGTIYDHTSYYTVLPSGSLEQALDIQADALQHSAIDEDELARELQVIVQEAKRKLDNPGAFVHETLFATMFDVHRMRRWRIGTAPVLSGFTRDDVWRFYRALYRASNTILVIAGDVDPDRAFELAAEKYGSMDGGVVARDVGPTEPDRREFRYREVAGDIAQTHIEWGWRTPGALHDDTPALDVLAVAIGRGRASRLYRHVRDAGVVASASAYNYSPTDIGVFGFSAELDAADTAAAFERLAGALHGVRMHGFTVAEVERARNMLEAQQLRSLQTVDGQAMTIASWQAHGDWRLADDYMRRVLAVTADDLRDVASRYLDPDALTVVVYRPDAAGEFAGDDSARVRRVIDDADVLPTSPDTATVAPAAVSGVTGRTGIVTESVEDGVHSYATSDARARIVIKPRRTAPLVSLALYCRGGRIAETEATAGITTLMARTSVRGTRTRSAGELAGSMEALGAGLSAVADTDLVGWSTTVPARHFEAALELLLDAALEPVFASDEAERERKIVLSGLDQLRDDMHQYPVRLALSQAFAGHSYGFDVAVVERAVRQLDAAALGAWHREHVLGGAPTVFVVGDIADPDAAAAAIAGMLDGRLHEPVSSEPRVPAWPAAAGARIEERDKAQTALALAFPGPARNDDDIYALQLLSAAISGLGGRLFEELRSRRSLAYAVSAAPMARWLSGSFIAYIGTAPDREEEARTELLRELAGTAAEPLASDELDRARRYLIGSWQIGQQTHARQLADLAHALLLGTGLDELRLFEERIRAVAATDVQAAAERWLRPERMVEGIVRGR